MALAGVVVTAFTLRLAVSGVSPVLGRITEDLHLSPAEAGVLAMMPSLGFALTGILTTLAMRRVGLEALLIISCVLAAAGTIARALTTGDVGFVVLTFVTMCGLGMGNVVLPPVIKKYFPHRIAALSALYSMLLGMSTATAPFFAVPLADAAGWRVSVGSWAVFSLAALLPWLVLWVGARRGSRRPPAEQTPDLTVLPDAVVAPATTARVKPWHSRIGWGVVLMFTGTSANTFSMFLWLPRFLTDTGFSEHTAGLMLSYYAILAVPVSFAVPFLVRRFGNTVVLGLSTVALYALGYLAVLLWPHAQWGGFELIWVWITVFALAQASFPLSITLINARTRTTAGAGSLSGFGQGLGYLAGSLGPLAFGLLFGATGSWWPSFGYLWLMLLVLSGGILLTGRHRFMEDDAAR
ncbi:MFS transporter [Kocuria rhizophila]|uniref:MFS transporter n=1 Tax=Kocuria rhizophila TaxID=72000 RepID=UPI001909B495|nr:MFS transporter [Kocuria rhizophila]MBK4120202.1 MFS transporter [Kocuria rhizophila]MCC5671751.1 MFS transporter [Kocuria rhizophila]WTI32812.1 MFS transporter [Kocuria rhizophila]